MVEEGMGGEWRVEDGEDGEDERRSFLEGTRLSRGRSNTDNSSSNSQQEQ
jgi:hypothetical protein